VAQIRDEARRRIVLPSGLAKPASIITAKRTACFITDLGTVLALGSLFADFNVWLLVFVVVTAVMLVAHAKVDAVHHHQTWRHARERAGGEIYFLRAVFLGGLAFHGQKRSRVARLSGRPRRGRRVFARQNTRPPDAEHCVHDLHPFYFIKAGLFVSLPALWASLGVITVLLLMKLATKFIGVWPLTKVFYMRNREANYTTLLMSTGLTFGTISALFGLQNQIIDQAQYTVPSPSSFLARSCRRSSRKKFFQPHD